ncbi:unnamed protein product, partial [Allacma fusca]
AAPTGRITSPVSEELQQLYDDDTLDHPSKIDVVEIESSDEEHPETVNPKQDQQTNWKNFMKSRAALQSHLAEVCRTPPPNRKAPKTPATEVKPCKVELRRLPPKRFLFVRRTVTKKAMENVMAEDTDSDSTVDPKQSIVNRHLGDSDHSMQDDQVEFIPAVQKKRRRILIEDDESEEEEK